jgi:hypothetical protein
MLQVWPARGGSGWCVQTTIITGESVVELLEKLFPIASSDVQPETAAQGYSETRVYAAVLWPKTGSL